MTYRTQLSLVLLFLAIVTTGLFAAASYQISNYLLRREVHRKVHSVASTAALFIAPADVAAIAHSGDENKPQYARIEKVLRSVRDANRRSDIWVDRIWTLVAAPGDKAASAYGVDLEDRQDRTHHPGDLFEVNGKPISKSLDQIHKFDSQLTHFQIGYDTGFAPIFDPSGKLVAELGVKLGWAPNTMLGKVWHYLLPPFLVTVALALILAILLSRGVTVPLYSLRATVEEIGQGNLDTAAVPRGAVEFVDMARAINSMSLGLRERETIKQAFSGYLSREVLDIIVRDGKLPELKGERRDISVLFADIRDFTSISETKRPEEVVELLSEFFERMVEVVQRNHGMIDKFTGDGMMAIFGAPVENSRHAEQAVVAAMEMQDELSKLRANWQQQGRIGFSMGIGINSGGAIVGNIGSRAHMEYTAIGDTVNLASRLQTATRELEAEILVSRATHDAAGSQLQRKPLGEIQVKGRVQPVEIYGV
jgi:adenylate cyclase